MPKKKPAPIDLHLNAFQSVRPRGEDAPTHTPPAKRGPKASNGTGLVLNIKGKPQAPLRGRINPDVPTLAQWKAGADNTRKISRSRI